jgi:hypothetical protein
MSGPEAQPTKENRIVLFCSSCDKAAPHAMVLTEVGYRWQCVDCARINPLALDI